MLGVCIPEEDQFVLKTKIPAKKIQGDAFSFTVIAKKEMGIPLISGMPFSYLDKLETVRLCKVNGQLNIIIS